MQDKTFQYRRRITEYLKRTDHPISRTALAEGIGCSPGTEAFVEALAYCLLDGDVEATKTQTGRTGYWHRYVAERKDQP